MAPLSVHEINELSKLDRLMRSGKATYKEAVKAIRLRLRHSAPSLDLASSAKPVYVAR